MGEADRMAGAIESQAKAVDRILKEFDELEQKRINGKLTSEEQQRYAFTYQFKKIMISRADGEENVRPSDMLVAASRKPAMSLSRPRGNGANPSDVGVPALRVLSMKEDLRRGKQRRVRDNDQQPGAVLC